MFRTQVRIDGAARRNARILFCCDRNISVGVEPLAGAAVTPVARAATTEEGDAARAEIAAFDQHPTRRPAGANRQELNDAAERVGAVQVASAAAINLDPLDRGLRDLVPEDPAAKRIVERHTVSEHQ